MSAKMQNGFNTPMKYKRIMSDGDYPDSTPEILSGQIARTNIVRIKLDSWFWKNVLVVGI